MDDYTYYEDVEGVGPCEFCGKLVPLMELILHETSHMEDEDVYEYPLYDDLIQPESIVSQVENLVLEDNKTVEEKIQKSDPIKQAKIALEEKQTSTSNIKSETKVIIEEKLQSPVKNNKSEVKTQQAQKVKEFTTKSGEKLLMYGTDIDSVEDLEQDKEEYKMPNNPVLSTIHKEKDEEDINNLSDDDSNESLEEFWKRARDYLKRNRVKSEC